MESQAGAPYSCFLNQLKIATIRKDLDLGMINTDFPGNCYLPLSFSFLKKGKSSRLKVGSRS